MKQARYPSSYMVLPRTGIDGAVRNVQKKDIWMHKTGMFKTIACALSLATLMFTAGCSSNSQSPQPVAQANKVVSAAQSLPPSQQPDYMQKLKELGLVVIDTSEPAYAVIVVVPKAAKGEI